jgi:glycosyltransferase involved in cell wall biosynthesis
MAISLILNYVYFVIIFSEQMEKKRPLRIGILTPWSSRLGGGVFEAVVNHALALRVHGNIEPIVFAGEDHCSAEDLPRFQGLPVHTRKSYEPSLFGFAPGLIGDLAAADVDLLHLHGIWMYPSHCGAAWAAWTGKPYVISPHGMLDPWITGRGRWKKGLARLGYENRSWNHASLFHGLTQAEAWDIARELQAIGIERRIEVVPNAGAPSAWGGRSEEPSSIVYIGRIHSKKNLGALIDAWRILAEERRGHRLLIAGWGEKAGVADLHAKLEAATDPSIAFLGPVYGEEKRALLAEARFFVLPSLSEGSPMAIIEAWAHGLPTLMTKACNLPQGFAGGAALEIGTDAGSIASVLRQALAMPSALWDRMSRAASELAETQFSPRVVAERWVEIYEELARR